MRKLLCVFLAGLALTALTPSGARCEDTRKKWLIGGGISYWSTDDNIRSNASTAYAPADPTQAGGLPSISYSDPRPDANELKEATIQDSFKLDFNASFGVTRWFSLELQGSYFNGDVGNIEFYSEDKTRPVSLSFTLLDDSGNVNCDPSRGGSTCYKMVVQDEFKTIRNGFVPVGKITEVPITLSGVVRFRPESPFCPYLGGGIGYIFTNLDTSQSDIGTPIVMTASDASGSNKVVTMRGFDDVSRFTNGLTVLNIRSGARGIITYPCVGCPPGGTAITGLTASVDDGSEFHLMGGADYYFTEHVSLYIDGRYVWAQSKVQVRIDKQTEIASGVRDYGCVNGAPICRSVNLGDFDTSGVTLLKSETDDTQDLILIQGGDIRLGGFSLGVGVRFTF